MSPGRSFVLCTATSASPRMSSASSSLVKSPLPPFFSSDHSVCASPVVTTFSSSVSTPSFSRRCAATSSVWTSASGLLRVARRIFFNAESARNAEDESGLFVSSACFAFQTPSVAGLDTLEVLLGHPWHHAAEISAGLLDRVLFSRLEECIVILQAALVFLDPFLGELAALNFLQDLLHLGL